MIARFLRRLLGATAEARSKANADSVLSAPRTTLSDADKPRAPRALSDERRAHNLRKLEARQEAARERHRQLMATKPGGRP